MSKDSCSLDIMVVTKWAIINWSRPEINGLDLATIIRQHDPIIKIILITGYSVKNLLRDTNYSRTKVTDILAG